MPFVVQKTNQCPVSRPYGVFTETGHQTGKTVGRPHGCFPSQDAAREQQKALYENIPAERAAAPLPPNLRDSTSRTDRCGLCRMYDRGECWGYGNYDVRPTQVCDSFEPESETKSEPGSPEVHMTVTASPVLTPNTAEWRRERAAALSETQRKRPETRQVHEPLEIREASDDGKRTLRSYASLFNEPYMIRAAGYRFTEVIRPGAFKRTLGTNPDVVFRTEHSGPPLAATWSGDLRLGEDSRGLWYEVDLDPTDPDVQALISKVQRGVYRESSFAFRIPKDGDRWNNEHSERDVTACELDRGDVSVVTFGASRGTGKHMLLRSEEDAIQALQDMGFQRFMEVFVEWRNFTLLPAEERVGKVISSTSMEALRQVLGLIADADDAVDEAEAMLSDFLGVPNPNDNESDDDDDSEDDDVSSGRSEPSERAEPTMEDYGVMSALKEANLTLAHLKARQLADPDNGKDPDDKVVMAKIEGAQKLIEDAIVAQSKDGRPDPEPKVAKRDGDVLVETPSEGETTVTVRGDGPAQKLIRDALEEAAKVAKDQRSEESPEEERTAAPEIEPESETREAPDESETGNEPEGRSEGDEEQAPEGGEAGTRDAEAEVDVPAEAAAPAEGAERDEGEDEYWLRDQDDVDEEERADLSDSGRQAMAKSGTAMPDGSYPIPNVAFLKKAIQAFGRAPLAKRDAVKAWIKKRAAALGASGLIPDSWRSEEAPVVQLAENDSAELRLELQYQRLGLGKN